MKLKDIEKGGHYTANVSNQIVTVRVDEIGEGETSRIDTYSGQRKYRCFTIFHITNLLTGRKLTFRSAQRFRARAIFPNRRRCDEQHTNQNGSETADGAR